MVGLHKGSKTEATWIHGKGLAETCAKRKTEQKRKITQCLDCYINPYQYEPLQKRERALSNVWLKPQCMT